MTVLLCWGDKERKLSNAVIMILRPDGGGEAGKVRMPSKLGEPGLGRVYRRCGRLLPWRL
ncbi:hypothetical protein RRH01S_01_05480 [Rhizobium rhizogenes NBRC 13257]|uniref:Uncharacterized protein n=1 Tax=Rhizobium rhizogenes NBRC 13257 TaxID=1220581 RepID=A0AA87U231_RHIRH|nr:hypothetical protein RRH01S_01_05480 [Rhizobium rhizogenes NBRC 13257]